MSRLRATRSSEPAEGVGLLLLVVGVLCCWRLCGVSAGAHRIRRLITHQLLNPLLKVLPRLLLAPNLTSRRDGLHQEEGGAQGRVIKRKELVDLRIGEANIFR